MPVGQKRAPDLITNGCGLPCGCWELNSGPLEEQAELLTTEPSLQPPIFLIFCLFVETEFLCSLSCPWLSWNSLYRPGWFQTHRDFNTMTHEAGFDPHPTYVDEPG